MVDSQSLGRENSGRYARQRASEVGFLYLTWVSKPLLNCPSMPPAAMQQSPLASGAVLDKPSSLRPVLRRERANLCRVPDIANYFFVKRGSEVDRNAL
jgi:hypothetical protein